MPQRFLLSLDDFKVLGTMADDAQNMPNIWYLGLDDGGLSRIVVSGSKAVESNRQQSSNCNEQRQKAHRHLGRHLNMRPLHLRKSRPWQGSIVEDDLQWTIAYSLHAERHRLIQEVSSATIA
jgi:hypothetical protein